MTENLGTEFNTADAFKDSLGFLGIPKLNVQIFVIFIIFGVKSEKNLKASFRIHREPLRCVVIFKDSLGFLGEKSLT